MAKAKAPLSRDRKRKAKPFYDASEKDMRDIASSSVKKKSAAAKTVVAERTHREMAHKGYGDLASGKLKTGTEAYKSRKGTIDKAAAKSNKMRSNLRKARKKK